MRFLSFGKNGKVKKRQDLKARVLKNREGLLDVMSESIKGARQCPILLGEKCIGPLCEFFMPFKSVDDNGKEIDFHRCAYLQVPVLLIENANLLRQLINSFKFTAAPPKKEEGNAPGNKESA